MPGDDRSESGNEQADPKVSWWLDGTYARIGTAENGVIVFQRSELAVEPPSLPSIWQPIETALAGFDRSRHALLIDSRRPAERSDPNFEQAFWPYRARLWNGWRRVAVLMETADGREQAARYLREDGTSARVFHDFRAALDWLAKADG
jgi:hypothetical protein